MKTEDLKAKGLNEEQIAFVMAENGKDVNKIKAERDGLKESLDKANETLKSFEGVDVNALKGEITKLQENLKTKDTELQTKLAEVEFTGALEKAVLGAKAKNAKAVMALLDVDALKKSNNQTADITAALEAVKKDNGYLFEGAPAPRVVGPTSGPTQDASDTKSKANEALRSAFGKGTGE